MASLVAGLGFSQDNSKRHAFTARASVAGRGCHVDRRVFLKAAAATAAGGLATPAISQRAAARALRFVPQADLANFDPIWTTQFVVRNASMLVWDTLYGVDDKLRPQRQMVESEEVSADGLTWRFRLREGLRFHDGEPVLAKDAVASINRWAARDSLGLMIRAIQSELTAVDDRVFRWVLKKPFPRMLLALGKNATPCCFVMPERIAATDPFKPISEYVGSGPMRFVRSEWVPGAKAVFEKFDVYVPRQEPSAWLAGGKRMAVDRIEWIVIPDPATAAAALQNGEVDWWEYPIEDLVPALKRNHNLVVEVVDPLGNTAFLRINHLHPPFNDVRARRALLLAVSQEDCMRAIIDDDKLWKPMLGFFTPGTPLYNEEGGEILKGPRDFGAAKRLLAESGYASQRITSLVAQDIPFLKAFGDVTTDALKRAGLSMDYAAMDWGTVGARRAQKTAPSQGGWHLFPSWSAGVDWTNPATNKMVRANGDDAWFGWPTSARVEVEVAAWFDSKSSAEEQSAMRRLNKAAIEEVVHVPLGFWLMHQAWRKNVTGIVKGPLPFFWGVSKTA
jgi:peptide/nickel transport system substrate-binding protein